MNNRDKVLALFEMLGACSAAREWARDLPEHADFKHAWGVCRNGDWMAWVMAELIARNESYDLGRIYLEPKWGPLAACAAAECALHHIPAGPWYDKAKALIDKVNAWAKAGAQTSIRTSNQALELHEESCSSEYTGGAHDDIGLALMAAAYAGWSVGGEVDDVCSGVNYDIDSSVNYAIDAADPRDADDAARYGRNKDIADAIRKVVPWEVIETAINEYMSDNGIGENQEEVP